MTHIEKFEAMKPVRPPMTEGEIRDMVRALITARNKPCDCALMELTGKAPQGHTMQCILGGRFMDCSIDAFLCALGLLDKSHVNFQILKAFEAGKL